jgi:hypothetical protein
MDFQQMNDQLNDAINRYWELTQEYFMHLDQNEIYGWSGVGVGLLLLIIGIILL